VSRRHVGFRDIPAGEPPAAGFDLNAIQAMREVRSVGRRNRTRGNPDKVMSPP
jgi:hypothetical protein